MAIYQKNPIRLQASIVSTLPVAPLDILTGSAPVFWRAKATSVAFAVFDPYGNSLNLSNLANLTLTSYAAQDSVVPLFAPVFVVSSDIVPTVSIQPWQAGLQQQATFFLTAANTDVSLGGETSAQIWQTVVGTVAETGEQIVYSAGYVTYKDPGAQLPLPPYGYVSRHAQTNTAGNATVAPSSLDHTEVLTVDGVARTSAIILGVVGITDGAILRVRLLLSLTPAIILQFKNGTISGDQLSMIVTDGSTDNALLTYVFSSDDGAWQPISYQIPST